jgi:hypothetical protein
VDDLEKVMHNVYENGLGVHALACRGNGNLKVELRTLFSSAVANYYENALGVHALACLGQVQPKG